MPKTQGSLVSGLWVQQTMILGKTPGSFALFRLVLCSLNVLHATLGSAQELTYEAGDVVDFIKDERPLIVPYSEAMNPSESFTLDFLMKSNDKRENLQSKSSPICSLHAPHFGYCVQVEITPSRTVTFVVGKGMGQGTSKVDAKFEACGLRSCWVHITCIYDASSSTQMLFVDGTLKAAVATSFSPNTEKPFFVGDNFLGSLKNIRVYSGVLLPQAPAAAEDGPPQLVGVTPPNGATVEPLSLLTFEFSETVQRGEGRILLMREPSSEEDPNEAVVVVLEAGGTKDFNEHVAGRRLVITPNKPLGESEQCVSVALEPGVVKNTRGTPFEGANYRVCMKDSTPPSLVKIQPVSGAVDLPSSTSYTLRFDEHVRIDIVRLDSVAVESQSARPIPLEAEQFESDPELVTLKASVPFDLGKTYELRLSPGGITDLEGNAFKGIQGHNISISAPLVNDVEDSKAEEDSSLLWLWVGLGVAGLICLCGIVVRRLKVASAETRLRYQVTVDLSHEKSERAGAPDDVRKDLRRGLSKTAPKMQTPPIPESKSYRANDMGSDTKPTLKRSKTTPDEKRSEEDDKFDASSTFNFSFSHKSGKSDTGARRDSKGTSSTSDAGPRSASKSTSTKTPKAKQETNEAEETLGRSHVALERSGVQVAQARVIGESLYRQMEERQNEPLNDRKRFFKELLLKWHPDKNDSEFAKDVVRFLQAQKDWFLKE